MKLKGKVKWAKCHQPDTKFEPTWSVDIYVDKTQIKKLKAVGLKTKEDQDGEVFYKANRKVTKMDKTGKDYENTPPKVVNALNQPIKDLIGNGSLCNVIISPYEWDNKYGSGKGAEFVGIQVLDLVSYNADEEFDVEEEFGKDIEDTGSTADSDDPF